MGTAYEIVELTTPQPTAKSSKALTSTDPIKTTDSPVPPATSSKVAPIPEKEENKNEQKEEDIQGYELIDVTKANAAKMTRDKSRSRSKSSRKRKSSRNPPSRKKDKSGEDITPSPTDAATNNKTSKLDTAYSDESKLIKELIWKKVKPCLIINVCILVACIILCAAVVLAIFMDNHGSCPKCPECTTVAPTTIP